MAKAVALIACFLAFATIANCEQFDIQGVIYCDPCKFGFQNSLVHGLSVATVKLTCSNIENGTVTFTQTATTDAEGKYSIPVVGEHQDDVCEVKAISSGNAACSVPIPGTARIECTENSGIHTDLRQANPLGFMNLIPVQGCKKVLEELELDDTEVAGLGLSSLEVAQLS